MGVIELRAYEKWGHRYVHSPQTKKFFYVRARNSMKFLLMIQTGSFHVLSTVLKVKLSKQKNKTKKKQTSFTECTDRWTRLASPKNGMRSSPPIFTFDFESDVCTFRNY